MDFEDLVLFVEAQLATMDPVYRARLVKKLQSTAKQQSAGRTATRAKMFREQRGRCAACGEALKVTGPTLWKHQREGEPLRCRPCSGSQPPAAAP